MRLCKFKSGIVVYDKSIPDARIGITKNIHCIDDDIIVNVDFADEGIKEINIKYLRKFNKKCKIIGGVVIEV